MNIDVANFNFIWSFANPLKIFVTILILIPTEEPSLLAEHFFIYQSPILN